MQGKTIRGTHIRKEEVKLSVYLDDMIYVEIFRNPLKKLLGLTSSAVFQSKVNIEKQLHFYKLAMNNLKRKQFLLEQCQKEQK